MNTYSELRAELRSQEIPETVGPTDRDVMIAIFNLVGALAEKLTGERPTIRFERAPGEFVGVAPSAVVTWEKPA